MKYLIIILGLLHTVHLSAQHTFSIVAIDPNTGVVGSAGASCIDGSAVPGGVAIISGILPGIGAMNSQATVCVPNNNLTKGLILLFSGLDPQEVIDSLIEADACFSGDFTNRQYGIVDLDDQSQPRSAAYTGINALDFKGHRTGSNYAIQGNILLGPEVLDSMEANFLNATGGLAYKLMAALQGANIAGADSRCLAEGVSSLSAYIRIALPSDHPDSLYVDLTVDETPFAVEPIDSLQKLFDQLQIPPDTSVTSIEVVSAEDFSVFPNPANSRICINNTEFDRIVISNSNGQEVYSSNDVSRCFELNIQKGFYFYSVFNRDHTVHSGKFIIQ